jgi:phosphohistidine phosphatase SixA
MAETAKPPPTIYYIRHGETDWNVAGRLQGRHDVPLNTRGRSQAGHCGDILRDLFAREGRDPADCDYVSSPLGRARETMELVRVPLGLPPEGYRLEERLAEIAFGDWEGFTIAQLHVRDPNVSRHASTTSGTLFLRAERATRLYRCACVSGTKISHATLWRLRTVARLAASLRILALPSRQRRRWSISRRASYTFSKESD